MLLLLAEAEDYCYLSVTVRDCEIRDVPKAESIAQVGIISGEPLKNVLLTLFFA